MSDLQQTGGVQAPERGQNAGPQVSVEVVHTRRITLAAWQSDIPFIDQIIIQNPGEASLEDVSVEVVADPPFISPWSTQISRVHPQAQHTIDTIPLDVSTADLSSRTERVKGHIKATVRVQGAEIASLTREIELLALSEWPGSEQLPELLAAFVSPNSSALVPVLKVAGQRLEQATGSSALDGYQTKDRARALAMTQALYEALQATGVTYINPPASFERAGQKIRTPSQVIGQLGTCLDLSVVLCALLEQAGLRPLLVLVQGHAFVGVWLTDMSVSEPTIDDSALLNKRLRIGELCVFDSSPVAQRQSFEIACKSAGRQLLDVDRFQLAVDVRRARELRILPLPLPDEMIAQASGAPRPLIVPVQASTAQSVTVQPSEDLGWLDEKRDKSRLQRWKDQLLDLSLRNRLLNFRASAKSISFPGIDLAQLEDLLAGGGEVSLHSAGELRPGRGGRQVDPAHLGPDGLNHAFAQLEQREGRLRADLSEGELQKCAVEIYRSAATSLQESGTATLFLAMGMLRWFESPASDTPREAPLILLPVTLVRATGGRPWRLLSADEPARFNSTLVRKLKNDFGLEAAGLEDLPEDDSGVDVTRILNRVRQLVLSQARWDVVERCVLGQFSFAKHMMWLDLETRTSDLMANPVVQRIMEGGGRLPWAAEPVPLNKLDEVRHPSQVFTVVDADPSQLQAICAAADGSSFVLQGPPGTGKSQTITNLIAQLLGEGKKVLFVSEKMAALNVVHDRLARVGLGPFCLELHSDKTNKRAVMEQIKEALEAVERASPVEWQAHAEALARSRDDLNAFAGVLAAPSPFEVSTQASLSRLIALREAGTTAVAIQGPVDAERISELRQAAAAVVRTWHVVGDPPRHPLRAFTLAEWSPSAERRIQESLVEARAALSALDAADQEAASVLGLPPLGTAGDFTDRARLISCLLEGPAATRALVERPAAGVEQEIAALKAPIQQRARAWSGVEPVFTGAVLERQDLPALRQRYAQWASANVLFAWVMLWLFGPHRGLKALAASGRLPGFAAVSDALAAACETLTHQQHIEALSAKAEVLLGRVWAGWRTQVEIIDQEATRGTALHKAILAATDGQPLERRAALLALASDDYALIERGTSRRATLEALSQAVARWAQACEALESLVGRGALQDLGDCADVDALLARWGAHLHQLRDWANLRRALDGLTQSGAGVLVERLFADELQADALPLTLERSLHQAWWDALVEREPRLRDFNTETHESKIAAFCKLDEETQSLARREVFARVAARAPRLSAPGNEMATLVRQLKLKRSHMPLRRLFSEIAETLGRLKPCVLMSPLSVAQYLDPALDGFDVVVFDEASQIPPWEAIGSLARARQAVVVGDSRQLPPTSFFGPSGDDDEPDELDLQEMESILDEMSATLPEMMLKWHYRSRHESLIAFSNHHYYNNALNTFPSAVHEAPGLGVSWRHVADGYYDRGRSRTNDAEAQAVVRELQRVLSQPSPPTVGVVTFSMAQQRHIEDLVDALTQKHPELQRHFSGDEPVFIKNLENVQGDERDVMLFSIGYGPDQAGKITMNFGPLNREGGERRLNVAITRARRQLIVFSTLRADQIDLSRTRATGARHLKVFLDYAHRGVRSIDEAVHLEPSQEPESPFEVEVKEALEALGWTVHAQIGCSGYRIDLGVVDPEAPGEYLLGIECDGATYHASSTARERDRLRQQVLEGLGWRIHRVWSTDWWFQRDRQLERLKLAVDEARKARADARLVQAQQAAQIVESMVTEVQVEASMRAAEAKPSVAIRSADPAHTEGHWASIDERLANGLVSAPIRPENGKIFSWPDLPQQPPQQITGGIVGAPNDTMQELLALAIGHSGPAYRDDLYRLVLGVFDRKLTQKARSEMDALFTPMARKGFRCDEEGVLWPPNALPSTWRGLRTPHPEDSSTYRKIEQIPLPELVNAAEWVLSRAKVISPEDLARETGAVFGFRRMTERIKAKLDEAVSLLSTQGRAKEDADRLYPIE